MSHFDEAGNAVMVDVSAKAETSRTATARGHITLNEAAYAALRAGSIKKGDVLGIARVAGLMGLKRTAELIPLCHPISTEKAAIEFELCDEKRRVTVLCTVRAHGKTGVEMEALCGAQIALLTIYDMCKALDKGMEIGGVCLLEKRGGKSGHYLRSEAENI